MAKGETDMTVNFCLRDLSRRLGRALVLGVTLLNPAVDGLADASDKVGVMTRDFVPREPFDWRAADQQVLKTTIWYPAVADAVEEPQWVGPPAVPLYSAGRAASGAPPAAGPRRPLILISHGNGGSALALAWFGTALAAQGYVVAAVDHPGNNARAGVTLEGLSFWWLRAVDLSAVTDAMLADQTFGAVVDPGRIGAAGHSLGGYTVIVIAGGITEPKRLDAFCSSPAADFSCAPPPDLGVRREERVARLQTDPDFRLRFNAAGKSYRDPRVRAVFAMAPGLGPVFTPDSLAQIAIPVATVTGSADTLVSLATVKALTKAIPGAELTVLEGAGHFVFFDACTLSGRIMLRSPCDDPDGIDRVAVQATTIKLAQAFFAANLR